MPNQTNVKYKIVAYDNFNNSAVNDNTGLYFTYTVIPEFPSMIVPLLIVATLLAATAHRTRDTRARTKRFAQPQHQC
jgi:hypothetical protein